MDAAAGPQLGSRPLDTLSLANAHWKKATAPTPRGKFRSHLEVFLLKRALWVAGAFVYVSVHLLRLYSCTRVRHMHMCMRSTMYNSMVIPIAQCLNCCHHRRWCAGSVGWRASLLPLCASCTWRDSAACTHECRWSSPGTQICHILYGSRWSGRQDGGFVWIRGRFPLGFVAVFQILRILGRVFSRLANIFVLLAQGLERGSYEPDVTGSIPVWDTPF